MKIINFKCF